MAHNDHLQQPIIERKRGAAKGIYYTGLALTGPDFIVIAPNMEILREKWALFSDVPLNEDKCAEVGMFSVRNIEEIQNDPT